MTVSETLQQLTERQLSDETSLRRVVAQFQRSLGDVFGNAHAQRRNRRYEIKVAVYEHPRTDRGPGFRMPERQIREWVRHAAQVAHPKLFKRMTVDVGRWQHGKFSNKVLAPVNISIDAKQE